MDDKFVIYDDDNGDGGGDGSSSCSGGRYNSELIESVRYQYKGNHTTIGINTGLESGIDVDSWQRYTSELPVKCEVDIDVCKRFPWQLKLIPKGKKSFKGDKCECYQWTV